MDRPDNIIERAFQLAECQSNIDMIRTRLKQEGYFNVDAHLSGRRIRSQLTSIMRRAA